jgi:hypothetical protein
MQLGIGKIQFERTSPPQLDIDSQLPRCAIWSARPLIITGMARVCFKTITLSIAASRRVSLMSELSHPWCHPNAADPLSVDTH